MATRRLIVIGAGPIGLEAALGASARGFEVTVLEQGAAVGDSLRRWGPTRLFSPLGMNRSARAQALTRALPDDALLTGPEMAERVLAPIARSLGDRVRLGHRVLSVGRGRLGRHELPSHPVRAERSFRLLVQTPDGEGHLEADVVLDASGVYGLPLPLGAGGVPAIGERAASDRVLRDLGALHARAGELRGRRVLLVGHGHSAANAIRVLDGWAREGGGHIVWATRSANLRPCQEVANDPLPERQAVVAGANALAARPPPHLTVERRAHIDAVAPAGDGLKVTLADGRAIRCDAIVALTGHRPDLAILDPLAVAISPVTEGADRLQRAISNVTDCLSVPSVSAGDLASGEPNFHLVGAKSYGRARTFLLQTGIAQLETILSSL